MKIGIGKRILMFLHWFFSLLICAALVLSMFWPGVINGALELVKSLFGAYSKVGIMAAGIAFAVIYALLCVMQAGIIFKRGARRSERGFITVDSNDNSRVRIAISAIEQMVRQSVYSIDGISDMKIFIDSADDAIEIRINASIINGSHVPTITMNMQQAIRKFVELNCGVAVSAVTVNINSVTSAEGSGRKKSKAAKNVKASEPVVPVFVPVSEPVIPEVEVVPEQAPAEEVPECEAIPEVEEAVEEEPVIVVDVAGEIEIGDIDETEIDAEAASEDEDTEKQEEF